MGCKFRIVGILGVILILVCLALETTHDNALVKLYECKNSECVECAYYRIAGMLVMVAAIMLCILVAQMVVSICDYTGLCGGVIYSSSALQAVSITAFLFSWCACVSGIIVYMIGEAKQYRVQFPNMRNIVLLSINNNLLQHSFCDKVKHGIFGAATLLSFAGVILGIISYLALLLGDHMSSMRGFQAKTTTTHFQF